MKESPRSFQSAEFSAEELFEEILELDESGGIYFVLIPTGRLREQTRHLWIQKAQALGREVLEYELKTSRPLLVANLIQKAAEYDRPVIFVDVHEDFFWATLEDAHVPERFKKKGRSARRVLQHLNGYRERLSELRAPLFFWLSSSVLQALVHYAADLFAIRTAVLDLTPPRLPSPFVSSPTPVPQAKQSSSHLIPIPPELEGLPLEELRGRLRLAQEALEQEQRRPNPNPLRIRRLYQELGYLYLALQRPDLALRHLAQASEKFDKHPAVQESHKQIRLAQSQHAERGPTIDILSTEWYILKRKLKTLLVAIILLSLAVILFSNRISAPWRWLLPPLLALLAFVVYALRVVVQARSAVRAKPRAEARARDGGQAAIHTGQGDIVQTQVHGDQVGGDKIVVGPGSVGKAEQVTIQAPPRPRPQPAASGPRPTRGAVYVPRGIEDDILRHLEQGDAVGIVGVAGPGGVGKTFTAQHLAQRLQQQDRVAAVYWVALADRSEEDILLDYAAQCGLDARDWDRAQLLAEIQGHLRARCRQTPVLVVLDDARPPHLGLLEDLLPPPPCRALVTSRVRRLPLPHTVPLDVMTEAQARALLEALLGAAALGAEPQAVDRLLTLTHRHPLALDVAGRRIREWQQAGYARPIQMFVQQLAKRGLKALHHDRDVAEVLRLSYDLLPRDMQQAFRGLAVFDPQGFTVAEAAGLWRVPENEAHDRLDALVNLSLARPAPPRTDRPDLPPVPRYALHDLLHDLARDLLHEAGEKEDAHRTLAEYYLREFDEHYTDDPPDAPHLAHAFPHLARLAAWAEARGDGDLLARLATQPYNWLRNVYHRWNAWRGWLQAALRLGIRDKALKANTLKAMGEVFRFQDNLIQAMAHYQKALALFEAVGDRLGQAYTLKAMGEVFQFQNDLPQAMAHYQKALALFEAVGSRLGQANTLKAMGDVFRFQNDLEQAMAHYRKALALFEAVGSRLGQANTLQAMGDVFRFQDDLEQAMAHYRKALALFEVVGDRLGQANTLKAMGDVFQFQKDLEQAMAHYRKALALFEAVGSRLGQANTLKAMGDVFRFQNDLPQAMAHYQKALALFEAVGDRLGQANTLQAMGDVFRFQNDLPQAMAHYQKALALFEAVGSRLGQANTLAALSRLTLLQGEDARAEELLQQALALHGAVGSRYDMAVDHYHFGLVLRQLGRPEAAREHFLQAAALFEEVGFPQYAQAAREMAGE